MKPFRQFISEAWNGVHNDDDHYIVHKETKKTVDHFGSGERGRMNASHYLKTKYNDGKHEVMKGMRAKSL